MLAIEAIFWLSCISLLASYVVYPLSLPVLAALFGREHLMAEIRPRVTFIVSAFNEAAIMREKLENALRMDYPKALLEIIVVSDASSDETDDIVREFSGEGVVLSRQPERRGKSAGLTATVPKASGEIVVFSDANSMYDSTAIGQMVRHFSDESVGYVVGHQKYYENDSSNVSVSERLYWSLEGRLKRFESRLGSVVGGDGAIYAIRRELFWPLKDYDISDFVNPLQIVAKGYRGIFDPSAICYEQVPSRFESEFRRKARIVNRAFRGLLSVPATLNPFRVGWFSYQVICHKLLRWLSPIFLIGLLMSATALAMASGSTIMMTLVLGFVVTGAVAAAHAFPALARQKLVYLAYYFMVMNAAALVGVVTAAFGRRHTTWTPERN